MQILTVNPGATSTKVAWFLNDQLIDKAEVSHDAAAFAGLKSIFEQMPVREREINDFLTSRSIDRLDAVAGRGGPLKPLPGGVYFVDERLKQALTSEYATEHVSLLGGLLSDRIASRYGCPAYIVDPVSVDEMIDEARFSGWPPLPRLSLGHALNMRMVARRAAGALGRTYDDVDLVVAHLGSGTSVSAHRHGRMIDVNNANEMGPFSIERAGSLPIQGLLRLIRDGADALRLSKAIKSEAGLFAHTGTKDLRRVEEMPECAPVLTALALRSAEEIGRYAACLDWDVDTIVLTGGAARSAMLVEQICRHVSHIAPVQVIPGENEAEALAEGVRLVLTGELTARTYC